jgi:hypothetical protein
VECKARTGQGQGVDHGQGQALNQPQSLHGNGTPAQAQFQDQTPHWRHDAMHSSISMAFHHPPPPSFDDQSVLNSYSISPNTNTNSNTPTSGPPAPVAQNGDANNNGYHAIPQSSNLVNVGFLGPSRNNSLSPMPVTTPPQPMFIGS